LRILSIIHSIYVIIFFFSFVILCFSSRFTRPRSFLLPTQCSGRAPLLPPSCSPPRLLHYHPRCQSPRKPAASSPPEPTAELNRQEPHVSSANAAAACHRRIQSSAHLLLFQKPPLAIYELILSVLSDPETSREENQVGIIDLSPTPLAPLPKISASHHPVPTKGAHSPGVSPPEVLPLLPSFLHG
jgi:hypothetical protein